MNARSRVLVVAACALSSVACTFRTVGAPDDSRSDVEPSAALVGSPEANGTPKRFFVSRGGFTGDLATAGNGVNGFDGADRLCTREAESVGLGGTWKAYLGGFAGGRPVVPADRFGPGPWFNMEGHRVFANRAALAGRAENALNVDARGTRISTSSTWVGFRGAAPAASCEGRRGESWTSATKGITGQLGTPLLEGTWSSMPKEIFGTDTQSCDVPIPLYCFEQ